jgi:ABC-type nitrate/sulfonate/bicarbonate transport system substrate-binding protein
LQCGSIDAEMGLVLRSSFKGYSFMGRNRSRIRAWACAAQISIAAFALVGTCPPDVLANQVRIGGSVWVGDGPTKVAAALDLFNQDHSESQPRIEVLSLGSGLEAVEYLMRGEVEFALAATTPTALALLGGLSSDSAASNIVVLASVALSNQTHTLLAHPGTRITSPSDLAGRRVAVMRATSSHFGWFHFAAFHGLEEDEVELVYVPIRHMAAALIDGQADAAVIWNPWDHVLRSDVGSDLIEFPLRMIYTINWLLLADRDFALAHPELVDRVLEGYLQAIEFMGRDPEAALKLQASAVQLDPADLAKRIEGTLWRLAMNWSILVNLGAQFQWLEQWPELAGRQAPEPASYLFAEPLRRVAPELVTLPRYLMMDPPGEGQPQ